MIFPALIAKRLSDFFRKNKKNLFFALALAALLVASVGALWPEIEKRRQNEIVFRQGKITVTRAELESSQKLEKFLSESPLTASPSPSPPPPAPSASPLPSGLLSPKEATGSFILQRAQERVIWRKILEQEAPGLGINLEALKKEAVPERVVLPDGRELTDRQLLSTYAYDENLEKTIKEKIERGLGMSFEEWLRGVKK